MESKKVWHISFLTDDSHFHEQVPASMIPQIRSAPHTTPENLKVGDTCPWCLEANLIENNVEFNMPYAYLVKKATSELTCPKCKSYFWQMEQIL